MILGKRLKRTILNLMGIIGLLPVVLCSCEGGFSGIYDDPEPKRDDEKQQTVYGFTSYDSISHRGTLYLNVSEYDKWFYISFKDQRFDTTDIPKALTGDWDGKSGIHYQQISGSVYTLDSIVKTDTQKEPAKWDIALHRYECRTANGAIETSYTSLDELPATSSAFEESEFVSDEWIDTLVLTDLSGMMNFYVGYQNVRCNRVLSNWNVMDFISSQPPLYYPSNKVYIVRLSDNGKVALHFDSYMSPSGAKGYVSVSFIYPY